jgi:heme exporter protein A
MPDNSSDSSSGEFAIQVKRLSKAFGRTSVLRNLEIDVPWGQVLTLLGPNGSGKTTLLKILATLSKADSGQVRIGGLDTSAQGPQVRRHIGVVTHDPLLYEDLSGRENLRFFARLFNLRGIEERIEAVTALMGMTARLDQKVGTMSHGMRKRFSIARAMLHDPPILLMDEPESGLDQEAVEMLDALVSGGSDPRPTVVITTHSLERAIAVGQRMAILANGKVVYQQTLDHLEGNRDTDTLRDAYMRYTGGGS